jgi:hypothetical protein
MKHVRLAALIVTLCFSPLLCAQLIGSISFSPPHPTTNDQVTVAFVPAEGQPDYCGYFVNRQGATVFIDSFGTFSGSCGNFGPLDEASLGKLPAGVYQVTWGFHDNIFGAVFPTESLTVTAVPEQVPALSRVGVSLLALGLVFIMAFVVRRNACDP